jgi:hypothetical protein
MSNKPKGKIEMYYVHLLGALTFCATSLWAGVLIAQPAMVAGARRRRRRVERLPRRYWA